MCVFFRDCGVSTVPKRRPGQSSRILYTLRFCARCFLAFIAMDGMYAGIAGAKACHEKIRINRDALFMAIQATISRSCSERLA